MTKATKTDYARKCQQLDVLIDLLEKENKRLKEEKAKLVTCDKCVAPKRSVCIWHNAGATYCSLGEVDT
jgi:hypothetical protein